MGWGFRTQRMYQKCLYVIEDEHFHDNNYKKLHGKPMKRWVGLTKEKAYRRKRNESKNHIY